MRIVRRWRAAIALGAAIGSLGSTGCQTWTSGMTLPSGYYLRHTPQYFPPDPTFPLPRELASMEDPLGAAARAGAPGGAPAIVAPPAPVPVPPGAPVPSPAMGGL